MPVDLPCPELSVSHLHGTLNSTEYLFPHRVQLTCYHGYWLPRNKSLLSCNPFGVWDPSPTPCVKISCPSLTSLENIGGASVSKVDNMTNIIRCFPGYEITAEISSSTHRCFPNNSHIGHWVPPIKKCRRISCGSLSNLDYGWVKAKSTLFESVATYQCTKGYVLSSNITRHCLASGTWSGVTPSCEGNSPESCNGVNACTKRCSLHCSMKS